MKNKTILHVHLLLVFLLLIFPNHGASSLAAVLPQKAKSTPAKTEWDTLLEVAKKEGSVVFAPTSIGESADVSARIFKEKYGINVENLSGRSVEVINKISTARRAGLYTVDVMSLGLTSFFNTINPLKITVPLEPMLVLSEVTDKSKWCTGNVPFVDRAKTDIAFSLSRLPLTTVNTEIVKEGEITSIEDLLAPKWKGKIVINDPSVGGPGCDWFTFIMLQAYGMEKGRKFMQQLAQQEPIIIRDERLQVEWVARGKYPIGIGLTPAAADKVKRSGAHIRTLIMKEGQPLSSGSMNLVVFDKAPHPNAAKLFANWVLSREGGEIMSKYSGYLSARLDVPTFDSDVSLTPGPKDILPGEEYNLRQGELLKVAAEIFKEQLK